MQYNVSLFIAFRYWRAKSSDRFGRLVTNLASLGIILGVMALITVLSVMNGLENQQKNNVLSSIPHAIVIPQQERKLLNDSLPNAPSFVDNIVAINTTDVIAQSTTAISAGKVIGVSQFSDDPLLMELIDLLPEGKTFDQFLLTGQYNVIIGIRLANKLHLKIGDKVRLMVTDNSQFTPFGRVPVQRLFTVKEVFLSGGDASEYQMFANITDIGKLMRIPADEIQGYRLFLNDPFRITELNNYFSPEQWKVIDWRSQKGEFFQAVRMEKNMMGLLVSLIIIVAISNIITSLSLMVVDKQGEIAILQTQGLNKAQVRNIFIYQGLLVGLVGTTLGLLLGIIATLNINSLIGIINPEGILLPIEIDPIQLVYIVGFSLLLGLLSTLYPAYRAAKIEPAEALRYE